MKTNQLTLSAILLALLIVCSQITVPMVPVPITLQTLAVLLIGMLLPATQTLFVTGSYVLIGLAGLPVFSNFKGGPASFTSPSFGFVLSFILAAYACAFYLERSKRTSNDYVIAGLIATAIIYLIGVPYLAYILNIVMVLGKTTAEIFQIGLIPFITGDALKLFVAVKVAQILRKQLATKFA